MKLWVKVTISNAPFRTFNIGNNKSVKLSVYNEAIEAALGKKGIKDMKELLPLQLGDLPDALIVSSELEKATGYKPATPVIEGVAAVVKWYRKYFQV